ncbi:MAG: calcium/sodium antiporter [Muribaculaceae bacterium]|nr:calcium/sodium antiporter [Muribaculaceae bacterium]
MLHDILILLLGLVLLVVGANYVTDGAVAIARRFKVSNLIIGLTVVALGSTLPDLVVCLESAFQDKPAIAIGEVLGSNTFDLLLVVGIMGIVRPLKVSDTMRYQDLPILLIASAALWVAGDSVLFDGATHNIVNRSSGVMLIIIFIFYLWFMILTSGKEKVTASLQQSPHTEVITGATSSPAVQKMAGLKKQPWYSWVMVAAGLVALVIGGNWVVDGAGGFALKVGMSQGMVALTIVAIGNALPDLVTSLTAALKGASGIALGNIVGSCIINALLSVGLSALVIPLKADTIGFVDFFTLAGASALIWLVPLISKNRSIGRVAGCTLVLLYIAYMTYTVIRG